MQFWKTTIRKIVYVNENGKMSRLTVAIIIGLLLGCVSVIHFFRSGIPDEKYKAKLFYELWNELKHTQDIKESIYEELKNENVQECPICPQCIQMESKSHSDEVEDDGYTELEKLALKYLVHDFEPVDDPKEEMFDYKRTQQPKVSCISNPEIDPYIHKPQFSRDQYDYITERDGYEVKRLVCDEVSTHKPKVQSSHWMDECDDVAPLSTIVTVIGRNLTSAALKTLKKLQLSVVSDGENVETPYLLVLNNHYDLEAEDANIWRMVREAESQSADVVAGSWRNENGEWHSSCLHYSLQNYTLDVWEGYYKSIGSMKYCDFSFGPLLMRSNMYQSPLQNNIDVVDYYLRNPNLRTIMCPDCMFYMSGDQNWTKSDLIPIAQRFVLNYVKYLGRIFEFTCPEANIKCSRSYYGNAFLSHPPCCLRGATGMMMAIVSEFERYNASLCVYCGQALAAVKMPGGQLPWDTDVDTPMFAEDYEHVLKSIVPRMTKYGLKASINSKRHKENVNGVFEGGIIFYTHKSTTFTLDNYAKAPSSLKCGKQQVSGRLPTKIYLDGVWVPGPDNPGKYVRLYGDEILRHVPHVTSATTAYNEQVAEFKKCGGSPEHACLRSYSADGNIQFRNDAHRLMPLR